MSSIKQTVESTLGFHGRVPDSVTASIIDALEIREAAIQADLLKVAMDLGLDEDQTLDTLHHVFSHVDIETQGTIAERLEAIVVLTRVLAQHAADLATLVDADVY